MPALDAGIFFFGTGDGRVEHGHDEDRDNPHFEFFDVRTSSPER